MSGERTTPAKLQAQIEDLCEAAQANHCPNDPPCDQAEEPLDVYDWCGVCLLVADLRRLLGDNTRKHPLTGPELAVKYGFRPHGKDTLR